MPTYTLTIDVSGEGSTTPEAGIYSYDEGTVVNIVANAASGWKFDSWAGEAANLALAETTVTMDSDKTVAANFSKARSNRWLVGGITAGVLIIAMIIWLAVRTRTI